MLTTSKGLCDREKTEIVFDQGLETVQWMKRKGVHWGLTLSKFFDEKAIAGSGTIQLTAGGALMARNQGAGLMKDLWEVVERIDISVFYSTPAHELLSEGDTVLGVRPRMRDRFVDFKGKVILASGGFEASARLRKQYLGEGWDLVVVRGTRFNTGRMLEKAIAGGAGDTGHWSGCHASPQCLSAPRVGDLSVLDQMSRYSYPYSIMVNAQGKGFMDEGEDLMGLTYAKTGSAIGSQPGAVAWQIFDQKVLYLLEPRYKLSKPMVADSFEELAKMIGVDLRIFLKTIEEYNAVVRRNEEGEVSRFDPFSLDGVSTGDLLETPKSNWALPINRPPYVAYGVTCGKCSSALVSLVMRLNKT